MLPLSPLIAMAKPVRPRPNACMLAQAIASKLFRSRLFIVWSLPDVFLPLFVYPGACAKGSGANTKPVDKLCLVRMRLTVRSAEINIRLSLGQSITLAAPDIVGGVAQLVRALACHARGRGFESRHSRHFFPRYYVQCSGYFNVYDFARFSKVGVIVRWPPPRSCCLAAGCMSIFKRFFVSFIYGNAFFCLHFAFSLLASLTRKKYSPAVTSVPFQ